MESITLTMDHFTYHGPLQGCIRIHSQKPSSRYYRTVAQHSLLKITQHAKTKESHKEILSLKLPDMLETSNLTEG